MNQEEITQGNILIAEFIGLEPEQTLKNITVYARKEQSHLKNNDIKTEFYEANELKYNSDWNWLMAVVEKIEDETGWELIMYSNECYWNKFGEYINDAEIHYEGNRKKSVYQAVIEFIKWHNENKS